MPELNSIFSNLGSIQCCECERVLGYFPNGEFDEDDEIEMYCEGCAKAINGEEH